MSRSNLLKKSWAFTLALFFAAGAAAGEEALNLQEFDEAKAKEIKHSLYTDVFDQSVYEEGVQFLRLPQLYKRLTFQKRKAWNVNLYDEVPNSLFFTNRHARKRLSKEELQKGPGDAPPAPGKLTIYKGKTEGVNVGFFVKDSAGQKFRLEFDPIENPDMASAAESISSRIFHAIGYNVPSLHIITFRLEDLEVDPEASYYNEDGFKQPLTKDIVKDLLRSVAKTKDGAYRSSASAILKGKVLDHFDLDGYRKEDPNDQIPHRYLREIRALRIFGTWVNYFDLLTTNTLDVIVDHEGKKVIKHYILDFGSTLGSAGYGAKPPHFGHEYIIDFGEFFKEVISLGFWEKPWQKRWDENQRKVAISSLGYFDNREFDPQVWKNQVPYHAFKDMTTADAYWAAKTIMAFTNDDIEALVETGKIGDQKAKAALLATLIERRDIIAGYWFSRSCPLDWFSVSREGSGYRISFTDLAVHYGLDKSAAVYRYEVENSGVRGESGDPSVLLSDQDVAQFANPFTLSLQVKRGDGKWSKKARLSLRKDGNGLALASVERQL